MLERLAVLSIIVHALLVSSVDAGVTADTVRLRTNVAAEKLDWDLRSVSTTESAVGASFVRRVVGDISMDGIDEVIYVYSKQLSSCEYATVAVACTDPSLSEALFQYNGPSRTTPANDVQLLDLLGDERPELTIIQTGGDSVLFDILSFEDSAGFGVTTVPAAIADPDRLASGWQDVCVWVLAGIDVNSDGYRDLIYSRSAKPDSAFQRGVVAYDIAAGQTVWTFETADMIAPGNFHVVSGRNSESVFICATYSNVNAYAANGMDSRHAYLFAIDEAGRELWRRTIGGDFFYPVTAAWNIDGDGRDEIFVTCQPEYSDSGFTAPLVCIDGLTGDVVATSGRMIGTPPDQLTVLNRGAGYPLSLMAAIRTGEGRVLADFDLHLGLQQLFCGDLASIACIGDIVSDERAEILLRALDESILMLGPDMDVIGRFDGYRNAMLYHGAGGRGLMFDNGLKGCAYVLPERRHPLAVFVVRHEYLLAVVMAAVLATVLYRFARWLIDLHRRTTGLIGLERINAMVLVLDRRGKIVFSNDNPLTTLILGSGDSRGKLWRQTDLMRHHSLVEALEQSYVETFRPVEGQHSLATEVSTAAVEVMIYPRIGDNNTFLGKIVIAEDISEKAGWERKIVLGEAAQRWIHRLKGSMATARITLENMQEDPRLAEVVTAHREFGPYFDFLSDQITETSRMATRILQYTRIGKPNPVRIDIGSLISRCVDPYTKYRRSGIVVVEKQQQDLPLVLLDPDQVGDALDNLLSNAVNAIRENGEIVISCRLANLLHGQTEEDAVEVVVEDTGCGMTPDILEKIFAAGYSRSASGTGIGLAVVREIVDNHGGQISVDSTPGKGSRFAITLPVNGKET